MNIFGRVGAGEGHNRLVRNIGLTCVAIIAGGLFAAGWLDRAAQNGTLERVATGIGSPGQRDLDQRLARMPRPADEPGKIIGIRYGKIDYTATATIKPGELRFKNTRTDPSLGMPD